MTKFHYILFRGSFLLLSPADTVNCCTAAPSPFFICSVALREPSLSSCSWLFHCIFVLVLFSPSESWLFFSWLPKRDSCHLQTQRMGCCHGISSVCGLETSVCEYSLSLLGMHPQMLLLFSPLFVSDSLQPCGLQSARLLCPWGF